ncbi:unnamed protein product [Brachionus calyciflorus]|uniref:Uncharacterized protein n=1 Tax=Brachionus calyciflorus TaxID=104777 RepID=A0A814EXE5_9BILA|nr:unnamed protein product [Brachionus calyciflorus]
MWILSENNYYIRDYGYQCFKKRNFRYMNMSFTFEKTESIKQEIIDLSRTECLAMIEARLCDNKKMTCHLNGCYNKEKPNGEFSWFTKIVYWNYECSFRKKLIIASKQISAVFNVNLNTCRPNDLFCKFHDSIVVWNESIIFNKPFFRIHYGTNYTRKNNLVYSLADRFLFQITTSKIENSYTVFSTTD